MGSIRLQTHSATVVTPPVLQRPGLEQLAPMLRTLLGARGARRSQGWPRDGRPLTAPLSPKQLLSRSQESGPALQSGTSSRNPSQEDKPTHGANSGGKQPDQQGCIFYDSRDNTRAGDTLPHVLLLLWEERQPFEVLGVPSINCSLHETLTDPADPQCCPTFSRK